MKEDVLTGSLIDKAVERARRASPRVLTVMIAGKQFYVIEMDLPPQRSADVKNKRTTKGLTAAKARTILHDGTAQGHPLTPRQRRFMGAVASGRARKPAGKVRR